MHRGPKTPLNFDIVWNFLESICQSCENEMKMRNDVKIYENISETKVSDYIVILFTMVYFPLKILAKKIREICGWIHFGFRKGFITRNNVKTRNDISFLWPTF